MEPGVLEDRIRHHRSVGYFPLRLHAAELAQSNDTMRLKKQNKNKQKLTCAKLKRHERCILILVEFMYLVLYLVFTRMPSESYRIHFGNFFLVCGTSGASG